MQLFKKNWPLVHSVSKKAIFLEKMKKCNWRKEKEVKIIDFFKFRGINIFNKHNKMELEALHDMLNWFFSKPCNCLKSAFCLVLLWWKSSSYIHVCVYTSHASVHVWVFRKYTSLDIYEDSEGCLPEWQESNCKYCKFVHWRDGTLLISLTNWNIQKRNVETILSVKFNVFKRINVTTSKVLRYFTTNVFL